MILIPKFNNIIQLGGTLSILHYDAEGNLIEDRFYPNIVVNAGKSYIAGRMADTRGTSPTHTIPSQMIAMGIGGAATVGANPAKTSPAVTADRLSDTGVYFERARQPLSPLGGTVSGAVVTYSSSFGAGVGTGSLVEAGIFNNATAQSAAGTASGTMLCITSFDVVNKAANDSIAITWTVTIQ